MAAGLTTKKLKPTQLYLPTNNNSVEHKEADKKHE